MKSNHELITAQKGQLKEQKCQINQQTSQIHEQKVQIEQQTEQIKEQGSQINNQKDLIGKQKSQLIEMKRLFDKQQKERKKGSCDMLQSTEDLKVETKNLRDWVQYQSEIQQNQQDQITKNAAQILTNKRENEHTFQQTNANLRATVEETSYSVRDSEAQIKEQQVQMKQMQVHAKEMQDRTEQQQTQMKEMHECHESGIKRQEDQMQKMH